MRLGSLKSLLATLSAAHYQTLITICSHWIRLVEGLDQGDKKIAELAQILGPIILRPRVSQQMRCYLTFSKLTSISRSLRAK
jgi:hypothetical protein